MSEPSSPPPIGHNSPPESDLALMLNPGVLRDQLELDYAHLRDRFDELQAGVARFFETVSVIGDDETYARAIDFAGQLKLFEGDVEEARVQEVQPLDLAKKANQKFFKAEMLDPIERDRRDIEGKALVYARQKAARERAEREAEQKRLQDEADAAAQRAQETNRPSLLEHAAQLQAKAEKGPAKLRGGMAPGGIRGTGATGLLRKSFDFELVDLSQVPREWLTLDWAKVNAAIASGLRDRPDGTPAIAGGRIVETESIVTRTA